jgi:hypothetical protein
MGASVTTGMTRLLISSFDARVSPDTVVHLVHLLVARPIVSPWLIDCAVPSGKHCWSDSPIGPDDRDVVYSLTTSAVPSVAQPA